MVKDLKKVNQANVVLHDLVYSLSSIKAVEILLLIFLVIFFLQQLILPNKMTVLPGSHI